MPRKPKSKQKKKKRNRRRGGRAPRRRVPRPRGGGALDTYARMLDDPCSGPIMTPLYGGSSQGYLIRTKSIFSINLNGPTVVNGYMLWYPDYHNAGSTGGDYSGGNIFGYCSAGRTNKPANTVTNPLGEGDIADPAGDFIRDPAFAFVAAQTTSSARTAAACMRVTYTGSTSDTAGRVGFLEGIKRDSILNPSQLSAMTIDNGLALSNNLGRTSLQTYEVKFRPSESSKLFRTEGTNGTAGDTRDNCFTFGSGTTAATTIAPGTASGAPSSIGIVWAGLPATGTLEFEYYKIIEWIPDAAAGFPQPKAITHSALDLSTAAVAKLDRKSAGGWSTVLKRGGASVERGIREAFAGEGLDRAARGLGHYAGRQAIMAVEESLLAP